MIPRSILTEGNHLKRVSRRYLSILESLLSRASKIKSYLSSSTLPILTGYFSLSDLALGAVYPILTLRFYIKYLVTSNLWLKTAK